METIVGRTRWLDRLRQVAGAARWFRRATTELAFPPACAGCDAEIDDADRHRGPFCAECLEQLAIASSPTCPRCGATVPRELPVSNRCYLCRDTKLWFDQTVALGDYEGRLRQWLLEMKQLEGERRAFGLAELMWQHCGERIAAMSPDVVVPVPMHWRRRLARGTNSPVLLAEVFARRLRKPLAPGLLRRTRNTPPQSAVTPSERPKNVRGAFALRAGYYLQDARVLVVDDILTTGSTCSAIARVLKRGGASHVSVAVISRAGQR